MAKLTGKTTIYFGGKAIECDLVEISDPQPATVEIDEFIPIVSCEFKITSWGPALFATEAGQMIANLPPIRFPKNRAGQLGNRCVRELEGM